jgi:hypothetical protein
MDNRGQDVHPGSEQTWSSRYRGGTRASKAWLQAAKEATRRKEYSFVHQLGIASGTGRLQDAGGFLEGSSEKFFTGRILNGNGWSYEEGGNRAVAESFIDT